MTEKEISEYLKDLILKYDYYDPLKDRIEVFKFGKIRHLKVLVLECIDELTSVILVNNFKCSVRTICDTKEKIRKIEQRLDYNNIKMDSKEFEISFVSNFLEIPFENDFFDVVVSFNTIHHRRKLLKGLINEMFRVSKNKVIISELNKSGAKVFDECISPDENHECLIINHDELQKILRIKSEVKIFERKLISTYVCKKNKN